MTDCPGTFYTVVLPCWLCMARGIRSNRCCWLLRCIGQVVCGENENVTHCALYDTVDQRWRFLSFANLGSTFKDQEHCPARDQYTQHLQGSSRRAERSKSSSTAITFNIERRPLRPVVGVVRAVRAVCSRAA